ncbi:MAG: hypothetical protein WCK90_00715 [archaeon]
MVVKKKTAKKPVKVEKKVEKKEEEGGMSLDDAFGDDSGVEYAKSKPRKVKEKKKGLDEEELDEELDEVEAAVSTSDEPRDVKIKASKPISKVKKGDKIKIDGKEYTVDAHYVLIDHGATKEMALELYDNDDKDYQLRYFDDQMESTLDLYELQEILYVKKRMNKVEW